jgi:hypothetical protein
VAQPVHEYDDYDERDAGFELVGEQRDEEPARGARRLTAIALTLAVMVLFAGGLWFAYVQGTRHGAGSAQSASAVPLLRADERSTKIRPDQPGGMPIPDQNSSLYNEKLAKSPVEKLLPAPEQPLPRPAPMSPVKPAAAPQIVMPQPEAGSMETAPAPAAATQRGRMPQANLAAPADEAPAQTLKPQAAKAATPTPPETASGTAGGAVQVRLGSLRSPDAAREEWQRLKRVNGDLLGNLRANAVSVDLGDKGIYYRIMAGPLDEAAAERLCNEMKQRNHGCIVAR